MPPSKPLPSWLHRKLSNVDAMKQTGEMVRKSCLNTVCEEARCPNLFECYSQKVATFLLLGRQCTRACSFCGVDFAKQPLQPDPDEPKHVVDAIRELGLRHVVLTMVTRDDLADGGAAHLAQTIEYIHTILPHVTVEVLTSDFEGKQESIRLVIDSAPHVFNHNVETVPRLTSAIRHKATYQRSLDVLSFVKTYCPTLPTKSGLMVGFGETQEEVESVLNDLIKVGVSIVTIGQYLQPSPKKLTVKEFVKPEQFEAYRAFGHRLGFKHVFAGPFVRSSYHASTFI